MVLPPPGSGRVGHRRAHTKGSEAPHNHHPHTTRGHTGCVGPPHTPRAGLLDALCWFVEAWFSLVSLGFLGVRVSSPPVHPQAFCAGRTQGFRCNGEENPRLDSLIGQWGPRTYRVGQAPGFRRDGAGIGVMKSARRGPPGPADPTRAARGAAPASVARDTPARDSPRCERARRGPLDGGSPLWPGSSPTGRGQRPRPVP